MTYFLVGVLIGGLGTLVGLGGGFLLVPFLLFSRPTLGPNDITAASLFCVTVNGISALARFLAHKQVHLRAGIIFSLFSLPAAWWGASAAYHVDRRAFEAGYATLIVFLGVFMLVKKPNNTAIQGGHNQQLSLRQYVSGCVMSLVVGLMSFFGVGGGIIYVPFLSYVLKLPVHVATATSQFILTFAAALATWHHFKMGSLNFNEPFVMPVAVGMIVGAQIGSHYSRRVNAQVIVKILAIIIFIVAARIFYHLLFG